MNLLSPHGCSGAKAQFHKRKPWLQAKLGRFLGLNSRPKFDHHLGISCPDSSGPEVRTHDNSKCRSRISSCENQTCRDRFWFVFSPLLDIQKEVHILFQQRDTTRNIGFLRPPSLPFSKMQMRLLPTILLSAHPVFLHARPAHAL